jgi:hypothetical protein
VDLTAVLDFLASGRRKAFDHDGRVVTLVDVAGLLGLTEREREDRDVTFLVRQAALLHADIAILGGRFPTPAWPFNILPRRGNRSVTETLQVQDGRGGATGGRVLHWDLGRYLLDFVEPGPANDEMARTWYRAAAAYMLSDGRLADAELHLEAALLVFPRDQYLHFFSGALHEAYSAPSVQAAGSRLVAPEKQQLKEAAHFYSKALGLDPTLVEARMRLARCNVRLGDYSKASSDLGLVLDTPGDPVVLYLASMALGEEEQRQGKPDFARRLYQRAADLFPRAQSPRLALAELSREAGNRASAVKSVMLAIEPGAIDDDADPLWRYDRLAGRTCWTLLEEARRLALEFERR